MRSLALIGLLFAVNSVDAQVRCSIPTPKIVLAPTSRADVSEGILATTFFPSATSPSCIALTNLKGVPYWSFCSPQYLYMTRPVQGGTFLTISSGSNASFTVSEMDLAGTTLHSLASSAANAQLTALGKQTVLDFDHEAMRLPNGYTAVISHNERLYTNVQGPGTVDILGDAVLVLDTHWKIVWTWNGFDFLPVSRAAVLGETCTPCGQINKGSCCPITLANQANDWLHANSLAYDPADGNLILSLRNQDWVVKIAYQNGTGNGHVVWTLGNQGDFAMLNTPQIPSPWFSHQHDVELQTIASGKHLVLFDNGNTRQSTDPNAVSRGQVLSIDETALAADIRTNVNLPVYSIGYGTAQVLGNGNYWFQAGAVNIPGAGYPTRSYEFFPHGFSGSTVYAVQFNNLGYRSFRLDASWTQ